MPTLLSGDIPLGYTTVHPTSGERPPALLLHGFGSSYELNWRRPGWVAALETAGVPVIGPDLRGHGTSGKPTTPEAYTPEVLVADVVRLLDHLHIGRVDVVGYSMGARLAWEMALRHPDRVRRAVLAGFGPRDAFAGTDLDSLERGGDGSTFARVFSTMAAMPGNDPAALAACARGQARRPFTPTPAPRVTALLLAAGAADELAADLERLATRVPYAETFRVAGRDHATAVSARALKETALKFLGRGEDAGPVHR